METADVALDDVLPDQLQLLLGKYRDYTEPLEEANAVTNPA